MSSHISFGSIMAFLGKSGGKGGSRLAGFLFYDISSETVVGKSYKSMNILHACLPAPIEVLNHIPSMDFPCPVSDTLNMRAVQTEKSPT